ncbi:hypothetical protein KCU95_g14536, partial [Aureobasidium melanogenum]
MASYEVPDYDDSDEESDGDIFPPRSNQELRLTKLGSAIPIPPQSDIPDSEGPEEVLPEVTMLNSVIMSSGNGPRASEAPPSSVTGKLKRPSLDLTHKEPTKVSREDLYEIEASPEPVAHSSSSLLRQKVFEKPKMSSLPSRPQRQIRTASRKGMMDTDPLSAIVVESHSTIERVDHTYESQERDPKRQKRETAVPEARARRSGPATRSSKQQVTPRPDLSRPIGRQIQEKNRSILMNQNQPRVPENGLTPTLDVQRLSLKSPRRVYTAPKKVSEVVVNTSTSNQIPTESTNTSKQPISPPAIVQNPPITRTSPVSPADAVQHHCQERMSLGHPADPVSPVVDIKDVQTPVVEESLRSTWEDSGLFEPCTQPARDTRSQAEILEADAERIQGLYETYLENDSEDDFARSENVIDEKNSREDIFVPKELDAALEFAHFIHEEADSVRQRFGGIDISKSYNTLKKSVLRWKAAQNYGETERLIQLSQKTRKEAKAIFQMSEWDQQVGLDYIYKRVLPTLVRMLYVTLVYYLSKVRTTEKLSYEPLKESRSVVAAILHIFDHAKKNAKTRYTRPQDVISMIARIKEVIKVFNRRFKDLKVAKSTAEAVQGKVDRRDEDELKLKEWRHRWTVLHDQRLGAAMEGRTLLSSEQSRHLRQIPLDNPYVAARYWDDTDSFYLVEGLEKFKGPNVYREIFRKYCRHGGPLQQFNVAEIVDKAVSLKAAVIKLAEDDDEEPEQWVKDVFDPRLPPQRLGRDERRDQD